MKGEDGRKKERVKACKIFFFFFFISGIQRQCGKRRRGIESFLLDSKVSENLESCDVFIFLSYVSQANVHEQKPMDKHINTLTNTHRIHTHLKYILFQICTPCYPLMHTQTHTHTKKHKDQDMLFVTPPIHTREGKAPGEDTTCPNVLSHLRRAV